MAVHSAIDVHSTQTSAATTNPTLEVAAATTPSAAMPGSSAKQRPKTQPRLAVPWLESPLVEQHLTAAASELSAEELRLVSQFATEGYAVIDSGLEAELLDALIARMQPYYRPGVGMNFSSVDRVQDAWTIPDRDLVGMVLAVVNANPVMDALRLLYRREPVPFQTLNFPKGTQQPSHSDLVHFGCYPERFMCGVWVALEDISLESGPLHYYPKSHKLPVYTMSEIGLGPSTRQQRGRTAQQDYADYEAFAAQLMAATGHERVPFCARKGQALLWAGNLFHGGNPIEDPNCSRHSQVTHYYFEDCMYYEAMACDPAVGQLKQRQVINLATGLVEPSRYGGCVVPLK